jgi:hypothetical protein
MTYRKGQRTTKHREADYPHAVDIPIPNGGLGQSLNLIVSAVRDCPGTAEQWSVRTRGANGDPSEWVRVGTKDSADADRIAAIFNPLSARRVR